MIKKKKKERFEFLKKVYEATDGNTTIIISYWEVGEALGFDKDTTSNTYQYLREQDLLETMGLGGRMCITHSGVLEIEEVLENPDRPSEHFAAFNFINVEHMNNSNIQQGNIGSTQSNIFNSDKIPELQQLVEKIENLLQEIQIKNVKEEIEAENETLKAQIKSPKPKKSIITESLKSLKNVISNVTNNVATSELTELITNMLN